MIDRKVSSMRLLKLIIAAWLALGLVAGASTAGSLNRDYRGGHETHTTPDVDRYTPLERLEPFKDELNNQPALPLDDRLSSLPNLDSGRGSQLNCDAQLGLQQRMKTCGK
jgi:hypothetical protein